MLVNWFFRNERLDFSRLISALSGLPERPKDVQASIAASGERSRWHCEMERNDWTLKEALESSRLFPAGALSVERRLSLRKHRENAQQAAKSEWGCLAHWT